jgi:hypothetical protein
LWKFVFSSAELVPGRVIAFDSSPLFFRLVKWNIYGNYFQFLVSLGGGERQKVVEEFKPSAMTNKCATMMEGS